MFDYIISIIYGFTQGLTEFFPVSSSGHLIILHKYLPLPVGNNLIFDVVLHFSTALALIVFFKKDIIELVISWTKGLFGGEKDEKFKLSNLIIIGTIPAALAGYFFNDYIEKNLRSDFIVIAMLIIIGILFIAVEKLSHKEKELEDLNWKKSILIGLAQALALIPGTSRSGITIIAGLSSGLKRQAAVRFSFLLSIPIVLAAALKETPKIFAENYSLSQWLIVLIAVVSSFIAGYLAIKYFLRWSVNYGLVPFAIYRFALALILLLPSL